MASGAFARHRLVLQSAESMIATFFVILTKIIRITTGVPANLQAAAGLGLRRIRTAPRPDRGRLKDNPAWQPRIFRDISSPNGLLLCTSIWVIIIKTPVTGVSHDSHIADSRDRPRRGDSTRRAGPCKACPPMPICRKLPKRSTVRRRPRERLYPKESIVLSVRA